MKKLILLLGVVLVMIISGCGKSNSIEGTWVPKQQTEKGIVSIELIKDSDTAYKGTVNYADGMKIISMYRYDKEYNSLEEDKADVIKKEKEHNITGKIVLNFNKEYTEAHRGNSVQPEDTFTKK